MEFDREELAWCSGLFDGEGHTGSLRNKNGTSNFYLTVSQKDTLVLYRFQKAVKCGKIRQSSDAMLLNGDRPLGHVFYVQKFEDIQFIMCQIWRKLDSIKREQYKKAIQHHLSLCWKPKWDKESIRKRESYKFGSVAMMNKMIWYEATKNIPYKPVVNPFEKINGSNTI